MIHAGPQRPERKAKPIARAASQSMAWLILKVPRQQAVRMP
jgi:hypothetical protein